MSRVQPTNHLDLDKWRSYKEHTEKSSQQTAGQFRVVVDGTESRKVRGAFPKRTRQAGKDGNDSNNLKSTFAAFKVVRAYKYLLIPYIYACAFKRKKGIEILMNYIE